MARHDEASDSWVAVSFVRGEVARPTSPEQLSKYDAVRNQKIKWTGTSYQELRAHDHPQATIDLDSETPQL